MMISPEGISELIRREGVRYSAYRDTRGIWTIGVGHTSMAGPPDVHEGLTLTMQEVQDTLRRDLAQFESCVSNMIQVQLKQNQFDALVSICYNIGTHAFAHSSIVRDINQGNLAQVDNDIMMWNKPQEIVGRREDERRQFDL